MGPLAGIAGVQFFFAYWDGFGSYNTFMTCLVSLASVSTIAL